MIKKNIILITCLLATGAGCKDDKDDGRGGSATPAKFYVDSRTGLDANDGLSQDRPFKSLYRASKVKLRAGDTLFLASGATFKGHLELKDLSGTEQAHIVISSYGSADGPAVIDAAGSLAGVLLEDCKNITVSDITIVADGAGDRRDTEARAENMRCGVLFRTTKAGQYDNVVLKNLHVKDIFLEEEGFDRGDDEVNTANGTQGYGWGIRFNNSVAGAVIGKPVIENCIVENVSHSGIRFFGQKSNVADPVVRNCKVLSVGGPGIQMSGVLNGYVAYCLVDRSGANDDSRKWGRGSGYWCFGSKGILVEHNRFLNANGPNDSAGAHIDYNCEDVVYQYNFSANNAGPFCQVLGNNYNCSYRYNISVNDGYRVKNSTNNYGATLFISGYIGDAPQKGPFNTYIYNNTIYVGKGKYSRVAVAKSSDGILIANNIFHVAGTSSAILDAPFTAGAQNVVFQNNLFLSTTSWNSRNVIKDSAPLYGDAGFALPEGLNPEDYIPANAPLVKDGGIAITRIPTDETGLKIGLEVAHDIMGNPIQGLPDMGAIEIK